MFDSIKTFYSIILLVFLSMSITGCDDDSDDPGGSSDKDLIGTWVFSLYELVNCENESSNFTFSDDCTADDCQKFVISADGTITEQDIDSGGTTEQQGTYELNGNNITICGLDAFVDERDCASFSFTISDNELHFVGEPDADNAGPGCEAQITFISE